MSIANAVATLYKKYGYMALYAFFGFLTTIVNLAAYLFFSKYVGIDILLGNAAAFVIACIFAYWTNRRFVFKSKAKGSGIFKEFSSFMVFRLSGVVIETAILFVFVHLIKLNDVYVKLVSNLIVIAINFLGSRFVVFKHK